MHPYFRSCTLFVYGNPVFDPGISTFPTPFHLSSQARVNSGPAASSEVAVKVIELEECLGGISSMCSCCVHLGLGKDVVGVVPKTRLPVPVLSVCFGGIWTHIIRQFMMLHLRFWNRSRYTKHWSVGGFSRMELAILIT